MTAFAFAISDSVAVMAADTIVTRSADAPRHVTKTFAVPHLRLMVGGTGNVGGLIALESRLLHRGRAGGYDELRDEAEAVIADVAAFFDYHRTIAEMAGRTDVPADLDVTFYVAGYSHRADAIRAFAMSTRKDDGREIVDCPPGLYILPALGRQMPLRGKIAVPADLIAGLREVYDRQDEGMYPGKGPHVGGAMLATVLTRAEIRHKCIGHLDAERESAWREIAATVAKAA